MALFVLLVMSVVVGFLCGCTSIGGILLLPVLAACSGIGLHATMATCLFSFMFSAALGTWLHHRNGAIDWGVTLPICLGAILFGSLGAFVKEYLGDSSLGILLAVLIILAGLNTLFPFRGNTLTITSLPLRKQNVVLFVLGAFVSFVAGLTGAGGPVLSVPLMIIMGYSPLLSVAVAQPFQVIAAASGSVGNMVLGSIDYVLAFWTTIAQLIGIVAGVMLAQRLNTTTLKKLVALMCIGTGLFLLAKAFSILS